MSSNTAKKLFKIVKAPLTTDALELRKRFFNIQTNPFALRSSAHVLKAPARPYADWY